MPLSILMKVEGVSGTSTVSGHQGEIPVSGFQWGAARNVDPITGLPVGKPLPELVTVTKVLDQTSAALGRRAVERTAFRVDLFFVRHGDVPLPINVTRLTLLGARVESVVDTHLEGGSPVPLESLAFSFVTLQVTYTQITPSGGSGPTFSYSFTPTS